MDKMREEFESWAMSDMGYVCVRVGGGYKDDYMNTAWLSWQASRAALRVELPGAWILAEHEYKRQVEESLDSAGVSYE